MKKLQITILLALILVITISTVQASQVNVYEFYQIGCPHCIKVNESGVLDRVAELENVTVEEYDIRTPVGYQKYQEWHEKIPEIPQGTPMVIIEHEEKVDYLIGDSPIINKLEKNVLGLSTGNEKSSMLDQFKGYLTKCFRGDLEKSGHLSATGFIALIAAAIIDSINPCAFGVLLFLMLSLLNIGSSKRALKAGLLYSFIVFIVYFLAGVGIFKIIQSVTIIKDWIYLIVGILVLVLALIEFRDYFSATKGKESILKISPKIKPFIEKYSKKGTIFTIMILGIVVTVFELPCTGGIYIAIISLLSQSPKLAYIYLLIYNIIFVLPLIIITFIIYKGTSPEALQKWSNKERTWMKLGAAIVMLVLAIILLWKPVGTALGLC